MKQPVIIKLYVIPGLLIFAQLSLSQSLNFRNYTGKDGLPDTTIHCLHQDSNGYIWFGTRYGLCRFDGMEFKNFSKKDGLPDNYISALTEDRLGNLWLGTLKGEICRFSNHRFKNYLFREKLLSNFVNAIVEDRDGILWFGTYNGLIRFDGKNFKIYTTKDNLKSNIIRKLAVAGDGNLWIGTESGLSCLTDKGIITYTTAEGLLHDEIRAISVDSGGKIWIGTSGGLNCFKKGAFVSYTTKDGLCDNNVSALTEDFSGNMWIGTWNGVNLFKGETFLTYGTENGLVNNFIYSIVQDREGNIWFGTAGGLSCLKSLNITMVSVKEGLTNNAIVSLYEDREDRLWIGTLDGLNCYSKGNLKTYTTADGLFNNVVNSIIEDRYGNVWVGTLEGLTIFSSNSITNYTMQDGLSSNQIYKIIEARDGAVWVGNAKGIDRFSSGKFSAPFNAEILEVANILEDRKGNLWFSSERGLYMSDGKNLSLLTTREGLPGNVIRALFEDGKGRIWIGTEEGVSCFHKGSFTNYSTRNGLPQNVCNVILEDEGQNLWFGTVKGLACFDGKSFKTYTARRHGLITDNWYTGLKDSRGVLRLGSAEGLTCFTPPPFTLNSVPPPIHISGVKVMDKEIPLSQFHQLEYNRNYIRIEFAGLCFSAPESVLYKYRLEGIDSGWLETGNRSIFYYLQPGKYRFRVKAVNNDGIESSRPAELAFEILPPFWQSWWFRFVIFFTLAAFSGVFIQWRIKRGREKAEFNAQKKELEAKKRQLVMSQRMELMGTLATGTVHDLKNLLSIIIGYSDLLKSNASTEEQNRDNIEMIKNTAETASRTARQILSFSRINDDAPNYVDLGIWLGEILKTLDVSKPKNIHTRWSPPGVPILFPIYPARFHQVVMNLCLNAIHAMPMGGVLHLNMEKSETGEILIRVGDSGSGINSGVMKRIFEPLYTTKENGKGSGLGLCVVKQIVEDHDGKIDVCTKNGEGTTFTITFPAAPCS
ncbi:MAG: hypothetical protein GY757_60795 [bacterium]|nr:hypothetical protein [bacterium]